MKYDEDEKVNFSILKSVTDQSMAWQGPETYDIYDIKFYQYIHSKLIKTYKRYSYLSKHCAAVRPMIGAIVRHCVGISLAKCSSFSSSSLDHSVFLMLGSSHSYHRALHCLADFRCSKEAIRDHWFLPYFITAALSISS